MQQSILVFLCVFLAAFEHASAQDADIIDRIQKGSSEATSPEMGRLWFAKPSDREDRFKALSSWAYNQEVERLLSIKGVMLSSTPEYCFGVRQPGLVNYHIEFIKKTVNLKTYEAEMSVIAEAHNTLKSVMITRAKDKAQTSGTSKLGRELIRRAELSKTTEERNAILFEHGYDKRLSDDAWYFLQQINILNLCEFDYDNTEWVKTHLVDNGWPSVQEHGVEADNAAALLVRRAYDRAFKADFLKDIDDLLSAGQMSEASYKSLKSSIAFVNNLNTQFADRRVFMCHAP